MTTNDRRVAKTKKALRGALAELLIEKELHNVTIRELTERADIHRATFYAHYRDVYDLYEQMENETMNELASILVGDPAHSYRDLFTALIDYVYKHKKTFLMFLDKSRNRSFRDRITTLLEEKYIEIWDYETNRKERNEEWTFMAQYHVQGCIAMIEHWAKHRYSYPKEAITRLLIEVDVNFDRLLPD